MNLIERELFEAACVAACEAKSPHDGRPMLGLDPDYHDRPFSPSGDGDELTKSEVEALVSAIILALRRPQASPHGKGIVL